MQTSSISNCILRVPFNTEHRYVRLGHLRKVKWYGESCKLRCAIDLKRKYCLVHAHFIGWGPANGRDETIASLLHTGNASVRKRGLARVCEEAFNASLKMLTWQSPATKRYRGGQSFTTLSSLQYGLGRAHFIARGLLHSYTPSHASVRKRGLARWLGLWLVKRF